MTRIDLLVLGLLLDKPRHGYEIGQTVKREGIDAWFPVSTSAIYYSLKKLRDQGLIVETMYQETDAPARAVFRLTPAGREAFFQAMDDTLGVQERPCFDYDLGIYMLNKLPRDRALTLLEKRLRFMQEWGDSSQTALLEAQRRNDSPLRLAILDHAATFARMEADWVKRIIRRITGRDGAEADLPTEQGLMLLSGDLRDFHFPDLIRLLASGQHTGTLSVIEGPMRRRITFQNGRLVCAASEGTVFFFL